MSAIEKSIQEIKASIERKRQFMPDPQCYPTAWEKNCAAIDALEYAVAVLMRNAADETMEATR